MLVQLLRKISNDITIAAGDAGRVTLLQAYNVRIDASNHLELFLIIFVRLQELKQKQNLNGPRISEQEPDFGMVIIIHQLMEQ